MEIIKGNIVTTGPGIHNICKDFKDKQNSLQGKLKNCKPVI